MTMSVALFALPAQGSAVIVRGVCVIAESRLPSLEARFEVAGEVRSVRCYVKRRRRVESRTGYVEVY